MFNLNEMSTKAYVAVTEGYRRFKKDQKGVTAIEYGLIAVAMAALIVAAFYGDTSFVGKLKTKFSSLTSILSDQSISKGF